MSLARVFQKAGEKVFYIFREAVRPALFKSIDDTGFEENNRVYPINLIQDSFQEKDIKYLTFADFIQPNDVKGLVLGKELPSRIHAQTDKIDVKQTDGSIAQFTVVAYDTDPLEVLYTFLLRRT